MCFDVILLLAFAQLSGADSAAQLTGHLPPALVKTAQVAKVPPLRFAPYSKAQFSRLPSATNTAAEKSRLAATQGRVVRRKGQLIITLANSKALRLTDSSTDNPDTDVAYRFAGSIPELQSWAVQVGLWENGYTLLIDQLTGRQTKAWSRPVVSPDRKHFITCQSELVFGDENGIQYWAIRNKAPVMLWQQVIEDWGPEEARWIDNSSIAVKQLWVGTVAGANKYKYVSVKLTP
jgi:hypothetical protein